MLALDPSGEFYTDGETRLVRVSRIIDDLLPRDLSHIPPDLLAAAAQRGIEVERHTLALLRDGRLEIRDGEVDADVVERLRGVAAWIGEKRPALVDHSAMVRGLDYAGTADFIIDMACPETGMPQRWVVDMKCTSQADALRWTLQVGAYATAHSEEGLACAVLHVNPKFAKGYMWREYPTAVSDWNAALAWWRVKQKEGK
jgi:hypothetical protein